MQLFFILSILHSMTVKQHIKCVAIKPDLEKLHSTWNYL